MNPTPRRSSAIGSAIACVLLIGAACVPPPPPPESTEPVDAAAPDRESAPIVSRSDFDLGLRITLEAYREVGVVEEDSVVERVNDIGYRVAALVPEPSLFTFHVIDLPYPNAFALPGGFVFVTRGMLEMGLTDAELAALLGHEIGHVIGNHFSRSRRLSSILSLAQVALLVGAIVAADGSGATRVERDDDMIYQGSTGSDAVIQGVPAFGGLFRTLVERKYGRGLEFEADDFGARLAAQAGYPPDAAVQMLTRFRRRIHEDTTYGYWLTHPFFEDRVARATVMARSIPLAPDTPPTFRFRQSVQQELFRLAAQRQDDLEAAFLYHLALAAEPYGKTALDAGREILRFRAERQHKKRPLEQVLGPIVADYDSLIVRAERIDAGGVLLERLTADRDSLRAELTRLLPRYFELIETELRPTSVLERFAENYPDHERFPEMLLLLVQNYQRSGRADRAIRTCAEIYDDFPESEEWRQCVALVPDLVAAAESPLMVQRLLDTELPELTRDIVEARMDSLVAEVETMEDAATYVQRYPESRYAASMRTRLDQQADDAFRQAKILEGVARQQQALDAYHRILFLAPDSPAAERARSRIDFLVRTG